MAAAASAGAASLRPLDPHRDRASDISASAEASSFSSSSTSRTADSGPMSCEWGGEEGLLDLDFPWVAAAEAESRLETAAEGALSLGAEEEQEEDEIRDNQQRQEDELMALEAIYGDDLAIFENKGGRLYFQIYIRYDVADGVELCAKLSSANVCANEEGCSDGTGHGDGPDEFSYTCNFEYLPPMVLTCLLPRSYPGKDPQCFVVTAKWMDGPYVSQFCEMLDSIWAELPGQEVVYRWVEWLRNLSSSYLWFDGNMTLGPDIVTHSGDNRAISRTNSLESIIPLMVSYSSKKHHQAFLMISICARYALTRAKAQISSDFHANTYFA
uniref:RWD domain-containing protein n=1 Tax=Arundo donax TaxID=35708 RepID=A0A0A9D4H6_ARUDO